MRTSTSKRTVTKLGSAWLTQTLDPFHDHPHDAVGAPDAVADRSVVYCINDTVTLTAPVASDLHVYTMPELCSMNLDAITTNGGTVYPATIAEGNYITTPQGCFVGGNNYDAGLFNWSMVPTGGQTIPVRAWGQEPVYNDYVITDIPGVAGSTNYSSYCYGRARLVSAAFEVRNTSAELYKGGASISYRMPQEFCYTTFVSGFPGGNGNLPHTVACPTYRMPPIYASQALLIPDSVVMESPEGNYTVVPVHADNGSGLCIYAPVVIKQTDAPNAWNDALCTHGRDGPFYQLSAATINTMPCHRPVHADTVGVFHTGLAAGSTITLNFRSYIEVFPAATDSVYPLSHRSTPIDNTALECLAMCFQQLPVSVPVNWNESSKWWRAVLKAMGAVAPIVGAAFGPEGSVIGGFAGKALDNLGNLPVRKTKPQQSKAATQPRPGQPQGAQGGKRGRNAQRGQNATPSGR